MSTPQRPPRLASEHHQPLMIGIDGGGSSTKAVLLRAGATPKLLHKLRAPSTNPHVASFATAVARLIDVVHALTRVAAPHRVRVVTLALSGLDSGHACTRMRRALAHAVQTHTALHVVHDACAPLGLLLTADVDTPHTLAVVVAGTGSVCAVFRYARLPVAVDVDAMTPGHNRRRARFEQIARRGGWGPLLGDEGGAYSIASRVLRDALAGLDRHGAEGASADVGQVVRAAAHALCTEGDRGDDSNHTRCGTDRAGGVDEKILPPPPQALTACADAIVVAVHDVNAGRKRMAGLARVFATLAERGNELCATAFAEAAEQVGALLRDAWARVRLERRRVATNEKWDETHGRGEEEGGRGLHVVLSGGVFRAWRDGRVLADMCHTSFWRGVDAGNTDRPHVWMCGAMDADTTGGSDGDEGGGMDGAVGAARLGAILEGLDDAALCASARQRLVQLC